GPARGTAAPARTATQYTRSPAGGGRVISHPERTMTLFIGDADVRGALSMRECIAAMERAFAEEARGIAANQPRARYKVPPDPDQPGYMANIIAGAVPSAGVAALRYDSTVVQERVVDGQKRLDWLVPSRRSWGFVLLFSLATGEPLALIQDF